MVGFEVGNTLSENGGVSRGLCEVSAEGGLTTVTELHDIQKKDNGKITYKLNGEEKPVPDNAVVSMNMWGFTPDYFYYSVEEFVKFLEENHDELKAEFYIPTVVNNLINSGKATLKVLRTPSKWFGVTYAADREATVEQFKKLMEEGKYPSRLF